jgi:hypothetical protein
MFGYSIFEEQLGIFDTSVNVFKLVRHNNLICIAYGYLAHPLTWLLILETKKHRAKKYFFTMIVAIYGRKILSHVSPFVNHPVTIIETR